MEASVLKNAFALLAFSHQFSRTTNGFGLLAGTLFRRLFIEFPAFHFPESPLALHFLLQRFKGLFDIVVANENLNQGRLASS